MKRKYFLIARSNIRKARGQTVSIIILMLIAALMLHLWLMISLDYKANFNRYHDKLNAEHVTLSIDGNSEEIKNFLTREIENDDRTEEFCLDNCMHVTGSFPYNGGDMSGWFVLMEKQAAMTRSIGRIEIVEDSIHKSGVYLPMIYKTGDIAAGNTIEMLIGSNKVTYTVCGFFNSIMMGTHNCVLTEVVLTEDKYAELEKTGFAPQATLCSVRITDQSESLSYETSLKNAVSEQYPNILMVSNCYNLVAQSRFISQMICSGIIAAMAFLVLLIALVVIVSSIINYMQVNMKNLGVLKAVGYTSKQLICALLFQFLSLTLTASLIGEGLSYCLFPTINTMMIAQTGIPYEIRFLPLPFVLSLAVLGGTVALSVWISLLKIKRIEPVVALRSGIETHNFKKNHIPLANISVQLDFALALKNTLSGIRQNITICVTMLILSLIVVFSIMMTSNFIADKTPFIMLIVGETTDACINVPIETEDEFLQALHEDKRVENVYLYHSLNISHTGGADLVAVICDDFSKTTNQSIVFEGRFPKFENEIAIAAKYAKENELKIGDEIEISANGKQERYLICGFTQTSNNLGRDSMMTRAGYEQLGTLTDASYYINLLEGYDIDVFNSEIKERFNGKINTMRNVDKIIESMSDVYVSLMKIIVAAILILSAIIVVFVLYLLVRTMLNNKSRDYGIMKALGYTTKQLVLQTALSFMPAAIMSIIVGIAVSGMIINPLIAVFLSGIGIVKCTFHIPVGFIVLAGIVLILFAFIMACLLSLSARKITPQSLLTGE